MKADRRGVARLATANMLDWILQELLAMARSTGISWRSDPLFRLYRSLADLLERSGRLMAEGKIQPWHQVRVSETDAIPAPVPQRLRVGVLPLAGNPIHWGHIYCALLGIERLDLDKVILVVAGRDARKPALMPESLRHEMAEVFVPCLRPYLVYSPIARGTDVDGEANLFRLLSLNRHQPLHVFYLAGNDHCYRFNPDTGDPDSIEKLERNIADRCLDYDARTHRISVAFFERHPRWAVPRSTLSIIRLPGPPIQVSSTDIRRALMAGRAEPALLALPYTLFRRLAVSGLFGREPKPGMVPTPEREMAPVPGAAGVGSS